MCDGVRQGNPIIFVDAAAFVGLAHASYVRHPQRIARDVLPGAYVFPGNQDGHVMVMGIGVVSGIQQLLPLAEVL